VGRSQALIAKVHETHKFLEAPLKEISVGDALEKTVADVEKRYPETQIMLGTSTCAHPVRADDYCRYVFHNIIENAVVHNNRPDKKIWIDCEECDSECIVSVSDNGPGIPDARKASLLNPDRRYGGVGLHQAKRIVAKYGGKLTIGDRVRDDYTQGARLTVWIPFTKD
jgi:signal transduction histidine kinase